MINKYFEKRVMVDCQNDKNDNSKRGFILEYYLTETDDYSIEEYDTRIDKVYGIEIIKKGSDDSIERNILLNISHRKNEVKVILEKIAYNTVTPFQICYILDDMLAG